MRVRGGRLPSSPARPFSATRGASAARRELEVLSTAGIPKNGVISVRAGNTRRQVQLSCLERPLKFPSRPDDVLSLKVEVLDLLGSSRLPFVPLQDKYTLPIDPVREGAAGAVQEDGDGAAGCGAGGFP